MEISLKQFKDANIMLSLKFISILALMVSFSFAGVVLKAGDAAPELSVLDANGKLHKLADYKGKTVALYFYPKDFTGGCTEQACNLRDNFSSLKDAGITILGISSDDSTSHAKFTDEYELPFPLLTDTEKQLATAYGVSGKESGLPNRVTFSIDGEGKILHIIDKVNTENHSAQIISLVKPVTR